MDSKKIYCHHVHSFLKIRRPTAGEGAADFFPPSRVIDLAVKQVEALDVSQGVQLTFTTPGDDYDTGTGKYCFQNAYVDYCISCMFYHVFVLF